MTVPLSPHGHAAIGCRTGLFLQVRLDSSRFPCKALSVLGGKPLVSRCMQTLSGVQVDERVLLCDEASKPVLQGFAQACGWQCFAGSRDNVLERFVAGLKHFEIDVIVRATGDNPLVDAQSAQECLNRCVSDGADHVRTDGLPYGAGVEVVRSSALLAVHGANPDSFDREHVCPGVWKHPERFSCLVLPALIDVHYPELRVTVDTVEDYQVLRNYFDDPDTSEPSLRDFIKKVKPHVN